MWNCNFGPWAGGGWMVGHSLTSLVLLVILGLIVWSLFRTRRTDCSRSDREDSLEILKTRLAKGELSIEEYQKLKSML